MVRIIPGAGKNFKHRGQIHLSEKGETGNPKGRPRKIALQLKHEGYKGYEILKTMEILGAMGKDELLEFCKRKEATVLELGIGKMINNFLKTGKGEMLDYLIPKKTKSEVSVTPIAEKTKEEVIQELKDRGLPTSLYID